MKIILAGSTGYIGREVLAQCLKNPSITSIVVISRRELLSTVSDSRLKVIIMKDFASYPDSALSELAGAEACIWSIGTYNGDPVVDIDYPLAFANAFVKTLPGRTTKFRYVHLGGMLTEQDQQKPLWYFQTGRRVRGAAEEKVMAFAQQKENEGRWDTFVMKPGGVMPNNTYGILQCIAPSSFFLRLDELAAVMVDTAVNGSENRVLLHANIVGKGQELLREKE